MNRREFLGTAAAGTIAGLLPSVAHSQAAGIKVALVTTLSGPGAAIGNMQRDGWLTAMKHLDNKLGGVPVETLIIDDELKPDVAVTKVGAALERDKVDFVVGVVFSNILQAVFRPVTENKTFLISTNAGTSTYAGRGCNPFLFVTSYQNDQPHSAMGQAAQDFGYKRVFVLVPNYQAGKDAANGFRSKFKGEIVDEVYVPLTQLDFSTELAKIAAAKPDALFTFMPGGLGVALVRQYRQAGLSNIPFLSTFTVDEATLPAEGDAALGFYASGTWGPDFDNPQSKQFVQDFEAQHSYIPGNYAAHIYDAAVLLDAAIKSLKGSIADKGALQKALETTAFPSVRGNFKLGQNHYPIEDFYLFKVGKRADGKLQTETVRKVLSNDVDPYAAECRMR